MLAATRPLWINTKPPIGSKIDTGHDLAEGLVGCWLFNEFSSSGAFGAGTGPGVFDLTSNKNTLTISGAGADYYFGCLRGLGTNGGATTPSTGVPAALQLQEVTMVWRGIIGSGPTANACLAGTVYQTPTEAVPYSNYGIFISTNGGHIYGISPNGLGNTLIGDYTTGVEIVAVLSSSKVTGIDLLTVNGITKTSVTGSAGTTKTYTNSGFFGVGAYLTSRDSKGHSRQLLVYNRILSAHEIARITSDSFCMIANSSAMRNPGRTWAVPTSVGVTYDAASNSGYQSPQSSYSWSHTCSGSNRFLSVDVEILSVPGTTVTGITYAGVAMSFIGAQSTVSGAGRVEQWGLTAPATGSNIIAVALSASVASAGTAVSRYNVDQSVPTEAFNSAQATNVGATDASVVVTTLTNNAVVHAACVSDDTSITANQTSRNNVTGALGSGADEDTGPVAVAGATTMSFTGVGALATWAIAGYGLRPYSPSIFTYQDLVNNPVPRRGPRIAVSYQ